MSHNYCIFLLYFNNICYIILLINILYAVVGTNDKQTTSEVTLNI